MKPKRKPRPAIRKTSDYSLFETHPHNRDISRTKVLEASMKKFGFDDGLPIRCVTNGNGKLKITHGHHRFHVARQLGLPIWYLVASNEIDLFESEASAHSWSVRDYTVARARAGESPAQEVMEYHRKTGIPLGLCISLVGGQAASSGNKAKAMKAGNFQPGDQIHADTVARVVAHCKDCGVEFATSSLFVKAVSKCLFVEDFDVYMFLHKVSAHPQLMEPRRNLDDYLDLIEMVYNRQCRTKIPLAFLADQASRKRGQTFGKGAQ